MSDKSADSITGSDEELRDYLVKRADLVGFSEEKKKYWVEYMLDTSRGERLTKSIIQECNLDFSSRNDTRALDIGCGFGGQMLAFGKYFTHVSGLDIIEDRVTWARKRVPQAEVICASATDLHWQDNTFDLVTAVDVFEHISYEQQEKAASELSRVLKPNGFAYISVPNRFQIFDEHNFLYFGTWMPLVIRGFYTKVFSKNGCFIECWERTGSGWSRLFRNNNFEVKLRKGPSKRAVPPARFEIFLSKDPPP